MSILREGDGVCGQAERPREKVIHLSQYCHGITCSSDEISVKLEN